MEEPEGPTHLFYVPSEKRWVEGKIVIRDPVPPQMTFQEYIYGMEEEE